MNRCNSFPNSLISIHAPPRGATVCESCISTPIYFNSRPSARGDQNVKHQDQRMPISIHAPPRGATYLCECLCAEILISIHAPPRGATRFFQRILRWLKNFNSRPSARGDLVYASCTSASTYFNSRPSARGDARCAQLY